MLKCRFRITSYNVCYTKLLRIKPDSGCITIRDEKVFDSKEKINLPVQKRNVGYVFQDVRLFPHLTIEKNLKYGIKKGVDTEIDFKGVVDILNVEHLLVKKLV